MQDRVLNCIPSKEKENDWSAEDLVNETLESPSSVDLRQEWFKVGDQGQTGSCVGWATAHAILKYTFVKTGKISKDENLSVRYIWMASKETDEFESRPTTFIENAGTSLKASLDIARKYGTVKESILPFYDTNSSSTSRLDPMLYQGKPKQFYVLASQLKISSYYNLGRNINSWKRWLARRGPILTRLDVDSTWRNATNNDGKLDSYDRNNVFGGHAVALVGYTKNNEFIVMNSWGTDWGSEGYAYASEQYATDAFTEAYGVVVHC